MKLIRGLKNLIDYSAGSLSEGCVATVGNFDGVHRGHRVVIQQVIEKARSLKLPSAIIIFEPQPKEFFLKEKASPRLMRFREKFIALQKLNLDYLVVLRFTPRFQALSADQFIKLVLVDSLHLKHLVIGDDFRFGCDRVGDYAFLKTHGEQYGFSVEPTISEISNHQRISSTRIRRLLEQDNLDEAEHLLGYRYTIAGCVIHGQKLGRQLGVHTANIFLGRLRPVLRGVYMVEAKMENGETLPAVANIGYRPTIGGSQAVLEVHLLGFNGQIYGQKLRVCFLQKLRDEQKFDSLELLKQKIMDDIKKAEFFFRQSTGL